MKKDAKGKCKATKTKQSRQSKRVDTVSKIRMPLVNTVVMTVKNPSKSTEMLCKQLKRIFSPNCLAKLEKNPKIQDVVDFSDQLLVKQIVHIAENEVKIVHMPKGPTYTFSILEYFDNYKNYPSDLYKSPAFITLDGKCEYKHIFESLGKNEAEFQRSLHFYVKDDIVFIRHYCISTENLDDKFKVALREIGPRLKLKLKNIKDGIFPELKVRKTYGYRRPLDK